MDVLKDQIDSWIKKDDQTASLRYQLIDFTKNGCFVIISII